MAWQAQLTMVERTGPTMDNPGTTKTTTRTIPMLSSRKPSAEGIIKSASLKNIIALFRDEATYPLYSATVAVVEV